MSKILDLVVYRGYSLLALVVKVLLKEKCDKIYELILNLLIFINRNSKF